MTPLDAANCNIFPFVQAIVDGLKTKLLEKEAEVREAGDSARAASRREVCTMYFGCSGSGFRVWSVLVVVVLMRGWGGGSALAAARQWVCRVLLAVSCLFFCC